VNQSAYDWYLRGNEQNYIPTQEAQIKALEMFRHAIEIDPRFAAAYAGAIQPYNARLAYGWVSDRIELSEAIRLARKAIELDPEDPYVLMRAGYALATYGGEYDKGSALVEKAVRLNPNLAWAQMFYGLCRISNGEYRESIENIEAFMRLSPFGPYSFAGPHALAQAYFFLDKPAECRKFAELAVRAAPEAVVIRQLEILSLVAVNRIDEAKEKFAVFAKDYPGLANATGLRQRSMYSCYRDIEKAVKAFRLAGLSD
jgi:tetratricopeptide (TPR) repeat protein